MPGSSAPAELLRIPAFGSGIAAMSADAPAAKRSKLAKMGILIESPQMAQGLHTSFDRELANGRDQRPGFTAAKCLVVNLIGWLPVEWLM